MKEQKKKKKSVISSIVGLAVILNILDEFDISLPTFFLPVAILGTIIIVLAVNKHKNDNSDYPTDKNGNYVNKNYSADGGVGGLDKIYKGTHSGSYGNSDDELREKFNGLWETTKEEFKNSEIPNAAKQILREFVDEEEDSNDDILNETKVLTTVGGSDGQKSLNDFAEKMQSLKDLLNAGIIDKAEYSDRVKEIRHRSKVVKR